MKENTIFKKGREEKELPKNQLTPSERQELEEFLIVGQELDEKFVHSLSDDQIRQLIRSKQIEKVARKKNPNSFWVIKGLPSPVLPKASGPTRHGLYIFLGFIGMFVVFLTILLVVLFT